MQELTLVWLLNGYQYHCSVKLSGDEKILRDGESNPGLPRDRRGYSPLYYRGDVSNSILNIIKIYDVI